jgi:Fur family zinc uptake transcriptional regulator
VAETVVPTGDALAAAARAAGFRIERAVVEAEGICAACREAAGE